MTVGITHPRPHLRATLRRWAKSSRKMRPRRSFYAAEDAYYAMVLLTRAAEDLHYNELDDLAYTCSESGSCYAERQRCQRQRRARRRRPNRHHLRRLQRRGVRAL